MKIAIYGYGNLGRGVEAAMVQNPDCELVGVFSRRDPATVKTRTGIPVFPAADILHFKDRIDVLILCGGSATDLPELTPALAKDFCVVDSFDTHANIPAHFERVDAAAREGNTLSLISAGWDPGMFSIARVYAQAILPDGQDYTFWGRGVSQGHSDAIRRIPGVVDARQYTVPVPEAVEAGEVATILSDFLRSLPPAECDVFLRRYWYFDSVAQIAKRFGYSESKVKMTLSRTRDKLRVCLEKEGNCL